MATEKQPTSTNSDTAPNPDSTQTLELHKQLDQCLANQRTLAASRNKILIAATLSWLIALALFFIYPELYRSRMPPTTAGSNPVTSIAQNNGGQTTECVPELTKTIAENKSDAETYIKKIRTLLDGENDKDSTETNIPPPRISSILSSKAVKGVSGPEIVSKHVKKEINAFIYQWALAWELRDTQEYFSYYAANFDPDWKAKDKDTWMQMRRNYMARPEWIKIKISDLTVTRATANSATIKFLQLYETPTYLDRTLKTIKLVRESQAWKIQKESGEIQDINFKDKPE